MTLVRPTRRRRAFLVIPAVAAITFTLGACTATSQPTESAEPRAFELTADTPDPVGDLDSLSWAVSTEPFTLAYPYTFDYTANQILANMCDTLLRWNADLTVSPGLATAWSNPDPNTWILDIRSGVTFHDGTVLTADDVVASLNLHLDPAVGSYWFSAFQNVASITATGDLEVTVTTMIPDAQFLQSLVAAPGVVESAATLAAAGADYGNSSTGVNCTGPFSFGEWIPGQSITLERYDDYWDPELVAKSEEVTFLFLPDPSTRVNAFTSGEVDGGWMVPSNAIDQLQASGAGQVYFGINNSTTSEIVSDLSGPLGDVRVRQALLMAIDREGLVQAGEFGYAEVADALVPVTGWPESSDDAIDAAFEGLETYPYDPEAAKELAAEAGVDGQEIVIATSPITASDEVVAQAVAAAATTIGLTPTIQTMSPDQYFSMFSEPAAREGIDLFMTIWYLSSPEPMEMYGILRDGEFSNFGNWTDPDYQDLMDTAISELDRESRDVLTAEAQQIASEQLPWLPLYTTPTTVYLSNEITGVAPSINYLYYPWAATIGAAD